MDVTLKESESYFLAFYLQGENSFKEDKDYDFYFVDPLKVIVLVPVHFAFEPTSEPVFELVPEPKSSPTEPTGNWMTDKVYSRKKVAVSRLKQV